MTSARELPADVEVTEEEGTWTAHAASVPGAFGLGSSADEASADLALALELLFAHAADRRPCPRKGERVEVLWREPGSSTTLTWQAGVVFRASPTRGYFVVELPGDDEGVERVHCETDQEDLVWRRVAELHVDEEG